MEPAQYPTTADAESANTLGTTASPLLAGFSMTLIGLIAGNASPSTVIRYPDLTLGILCIATVLFVLSVQFTVIARKFNVTPAEHTARTPNLTDDTRQSAYGEMVKDWYYWVELARLLFHLGLGIMFLGLAGVMLPPNASCFRLTIVSLPIVTFFGELVWFVKEFIKSRNFKNSLGSR